MSEFLNKALEMLDDGWWVVPIHPDEKHPAPKWGHIYDEGKFPTEEQVIDWWEKFPNAHVGIITGELSGVLVVDCDNEEAEEYAQSLAQGDKDLDMVEEFVNRTAAGVPLSSSLQKTASASDSSESDVLTNFLLTSDF